MVLAVGLSFLQIMGITANFDKPDRIETVYGTYDVWEMSEDQFNRYRIELVIFTIVAELIVALFLVKAFGEQKEARKTPGAGAG